MKIHCDLIVFFFLSAHKMYSEMKFRLFIGFQFCYLQPWLSNKNRFLKEYTRVSERTFTQKFLFVSIAKQLCFFKRFAWRQAWDIWPQSKQWNFFPLGNEFFFVSKKFFFNFSKTNMSAQKMFSKGVNVKVTSHLQGHKKNRFSFSWQNWSHSCCLKFAKDKNLKISKSSRVI